MADIITGDVLGKCEKKGHEQLLKVGMTSAMCNICAQAGVESIVRPIESNVPSQS